MPFVVKKWQQVSRLLGDIQTIAYLTSSEWGELHKEITEQYKDATKGQLSRDTFTECLIDKNLTLRNSGTEDQNEVNMLNVISLGEDNLAKLAWRRQHFQTGNQVLQAPKPDGGFYQPGDHEGNEVPDV